MSSYGSTVSTPTCGGHGANSAGIELDDEPNTFEPEDEPVATDPE